MLLVLRKLIAERLLEKRQNEKGFTLIELIMVIVILGILSAVAIPKFVDLSASAETAALKGVVGAMGAAGAINKAGCASTSYTVTTDVCVAVTDCSQISSLLDGGLPTGYTVTAGTIGAHPAVVACTVTQTSTGNTLTFQLPGTS